MTLAATPRIVEYQGNGSTLVFAVPFQFRTGAALKVWLRSAAGVETLQTSGSQYSVSGGSGSTGSVTFATAPPTGTTVVIRGRLAIQQQRSYQNNDRFPAEQHEGALDDLAAISREQQDQIEDVGGRALLVPNGEAGLALPPAASRPGKFLAFDGTGKAIAASGTGADGALRTDLADADAGAAIVVTSAGDTVDAALAALRFFNLDAVRNAEIPASIKRLIVQNYAVEGDGGGIPYRKVENQPNHALKVQSADGAWWEGDVLTMPAEAVGTIGDWDDDAGAGTDNRAALAKCCELLAAGAVRAIELRDGAKYWLGDFSAVAQTAVFGIDVTSGMSGAIRGNADLVVTAGPAAIQDIFLIQDARNLTFEELHFRDTLTHNNSGSAPKGCRAVTLFGGGGTDGNGTAISGITFRNCKFNRLLVCVQNFTSDIASPLRVSGIRFEGDNVATDCYYGLGFANSGDDVRGSFTTYNARRTIITYGVRGHDLDLTISNDDAATGSTGTIKIERVARDTYDLKYRVRFSGTVAAHVPVSFEHQNDDGAASRFDGIDLDLFFPNGVNAGVNSPAVMFSAQGPQPGNVLHDTPLNADGSTGAQISPVTTEQQFGNISITIKCNEFSDANPFLKANVVPLYPGNITINAPAGLTDKSSYMRGFRVNGAYVYETSGNLDGKVVHIPLWDFPGSFVVIDMEVFAFNGGTKQHLRNYAQHAYVAGSGAIYLIDGLSAGTDFSTTSGSDLIVTTIDDPTKLDRLMLNLASAADYTSGSFVRVTARVRNLAQ